VTLRLADFATFAGLAEAIESVLRGGEEPARSAGQDGAGAAGAAGLVVREAPGPT